MTNWLNDEIAQKFWALEVRWQLMCTEDKKKNGWRLFSRLKCEFSIWNVREWKAWIARTNATELAFRYTHTDRKVTANTERWIDGKRFSNRCTTRSYNLLFSNGAHIFNGLSQSGKCNFKTRMWKEISIWLLLAYTDAQFIWKIRYFFASSFQDR